MRVAYIDTSCIIRLLTPDHPERQPLVDLLDQYSLWDDLVTSQITRLECVRVAMRDGNEDMGILAEKMLDAMTIIPVSDEVFGLAMEIPFRVKSLDAIHIASAAQAHMIITSDKNMKSVLNQLKESNEFPIYHFHEIAG